MVVGEFTERYGAKRRAELVKQLPASLSTVQFIACDGDTLEIRSSESSKSLFRKIGESRRRSLISVPELLTRLCLASGRSQDEVQDEGDETFIGGGLRTIEPASDCRSLLDVSDSSVATQNRP